MGIQDILSSRRNNSASAALPDLIAHEDWQLVLMECKMWPKDASKWTIREGFFDGEHDSRVLPIHMAVAMQCPPEVVHALVDCYPLGIHMREEAFQRLPLHVACQDNAPIETIEALIHHYPEATRAKDSIGRLPIHYACSHNAPSSVIELLLREFPASAGCGDDNGWLPIHVACRRGVSLYVIERLLDCFPQSVDMATNKGSTPVICAKKGGDSQRHEDIIQYLESYMKGKSPPTITPSMLGKGKVDAGRCVPMGGMPASATLHHRNVHARGA